MLQFKRLVSGGIITNYDCSPKCRHCVYASFRNLAECAAPEKYPVLYALDLTGVKGLYDLAVNRYGFVPGDKYTGKCDLCYDIRKFLVMDAKLDLPDLQPRGHYIYM